MTNGSQTTTACKLKNGNIMSKAQTFSANKYFDSSIPTRQPGPNQARMKRPKERQKKGSHKYLRPVWPSMLSGGFSDCWLIQRNAPTWTTKANPIESTGKKVRTDSELTLCDSPASFDLIMCHFPSTIWAIQLFCSF